MVQLEKYDTTRTTDNNKVAAFARRWAGLVLTRRNDYVLKFDYCFRPLCSQMR